MSAEEQAVALYEKMTAEKEAAAVAEVESERFGGKYVLNRTKALQTGRDVKVRRRCVQERIFGKAQNFFSYF